MTAAARRSKGRGAIRRLWFLVALVCAAATIVGYAIADNVAGNVNAAIDGFAAGALLVMLIDWKHLGPCRRAATRRDW